MLICDRSSFQNNDGKRTHSVKSQFPKDIFKSFGSGQQWTTVTGKLFYVLAPLKETLAKQADKGSKIEEHIHLPTFHIVMVQFIELQADFG